MIQLTVRLPTSVASSSIRLYSAGLIGGEAYRPSSMDLRRDVRVLINALRTRDYGAISNNKCRVQAIIDKLLIYQAAAPMGKTILGYLAPLR